VETNNQNTGVAIAAPIKETIDKVLTMSPARQEVFIEFGKQGVNIAVLNNNLAILEKNVTDKFNALPETITDIAAAEEVLKEIKKTQTTINDTRIAGVKPINDKLATLMVYEKNLATPIQLLTTRIIAAKKIKEAADNAARLKDAEIAQYQSYIDRCVADTEAAFSTYINSQVLAAYNHALGAGNIAVDKKESFIDEVCKKRGTDANFTHTIKPFDWKYNTPAQPQEVDINAKLASPKTYVDQFRAKMIEQFMDYDLAFENKEIALKRAKDDADKEASEIRQTQTMANTMANINAVATDLVVDDGIKALKKSYIVDVAESWDEARKISIAFWSTVKVFKDLRMKPFNITPQQMADYLGKIKTEDNNFEITGIKWKEVEKL